MVECDRFGDEKVGEHTKQFLRLLHSLKGSAQAVDETLCSEICHELESHFLDIGPKETPWSEEQIYTVFTFLNLLKPSTESDSRTKVTQDFKAVMSQFSSQTEKKTSYLTSLASAFPM